MVRRWGRLLLVRLMVVSVLILVAGCAGQAEPSPAESTEAVPGAATTTTVAATSTSQATTTSLSNTLAKRFGESARWVSTGGGDTDPSWDVVVYAPEPVKDAKYVADGKEPWASLVQFTNTSAASANYNALSFQLVDQESFRYRPTSISCGLQDLNCGTLEPFGIVKGYLMFELPAGTEPASIIYEPDPLGNAICTWSLSAS